MDIRKLLEKMTFEEALETTKIHSVAGIVKDGEGIIYNRPFRSPHHTASTVSLTGGGSSLRPGEISLAHNGLIPDIESKIILSAPLKTEKSNSVSFEILVRYVLFCTGGN